MGKSGKKDKKHDTKDAGEKDVATSVREHLRVGEGFELAAVDPDEVSIGPGDKDQARAEVDDLEDETNELHERLWAESRKGGQRALLIVLQGMDTAGKGGASKTIDSLLDPLGFSVVSFGKPTDEEQARGYLWRHEAQLPTAGRIKLFDRSHYETVLVERVRELVPVDVWSARYDQINAWEAGLVERGITLLKCMLHIANDEQRERLTERLEDPTKHWKYNPGDVDERVYWDAYMAAYQDALTRCSTDAAPWYVVPSNRKWHRNWLIAHLLVETLREIDPQYPPADFDVEAEKARLAAS